VQRTYIQVPDCQYPVALPVDHSTYTIPVYQQLLGTYKYQHPAPGFHFQVVWPVNNLTKQHSYMILAPRTGSNLNHDIIHIIKHKNSATTATICKL